MATATDNTDAIVHPHQSIWRRWGRHQDWAQKVEEQAVRKALDIPDNDLNIDASKTQTGAGTGALAAAALAGGFPATILAVALGIGAMRGPSTTTSPMQSAVPDSEYEVRFYDKDGKLIDVPRLPKK